MGPDDELLVVNDGSTDETESVLREQVGPISTITTRNRGKAAALNLALQNTDRPHVWIVDDDDILEPNARSHLLQQFDRDPGAEIAYGRYLRFNSDGTEPRARKSLLQTGYWVDCKSDRFLLATMEDMFVHQPGMIVARSLYDRVGPFDESLNRSVDYDMLVRLAIEGRAVSTDRVVFYQRQHAGLRGSSAARIRSGDMDDVWVESDEKIFRRLHAELPLSVYVSKRQIGNRIDRRQALLQRGTIMMRKRAWNIALRDFHLALDQTEAPLRSSDRIIARRAFSSKYGCQKLFRSRRLMRGIASLAARSAAGRELARALARGLLWRVREAVRNRRPADAANYAKAVLYFIFASTRLGAMFMPKRQHTGDPLDQGLTSSS